MGFKLSSVPNPTHVTDRNNKIDGHEDHRLLGKHEHRVQRKAVPQWWRQNEEET